MTQTADDREAILARLATVLESLPGVEHFSRNDLALPEDSVPAILMLDGDETVKEDSYGRGSRLPGSVKIFTLQPEVYILVGDDPSLVGPSLSQLRRRVVKAVLTDDELLALAVDKSVRYEGMQTGMAMGRSLAGEAALNFSIDYQFDAIALPPINSTIYLSGSVAGEARLNGILAQALQGDFAGGGELDGALAQLLSGSVEGGGSMDGTFSNNVLLSGSVSGGGEVTGAFSGIVELMGSVSAGGLLAGDLSIRRTLSGSVEAGGTLTGDATVQVALSGAVAGEGGLTGNIEPPPSAVFVGASAAQYSTSGFTLSVHPDTQVGDFLVLVQCSGGNDTTSPTGGWTGIGGSNFHTGIGAEPNGTSMVLRRKSATGPSETINIPDSGGHNAAVVLTFRGMTTANYTSSATGAASSTSIVAAGSAAFNEDDFCLFAFAGRGSMNSPAVSSSASFDGEAVAANVVASLSLFVAVGQAASTGTFTFLTGSWTGGVTNRVTVASRIRP